jgi:predicted metalloendopeptidase
VCTYGSRNDIVISAAILQPPLFNIAYPPFMNFGASGMVIGHELTHAFDDQGKKFDATGNLSNWWTPSVDQEFTKRAQCVIDQYSQFEVVPGVYINGVQTQGENIADMGGIRIAYMAFQSWTSKMGQGTSCNELSLNKFRRYRRGVLEII